MGLKFTHALSRLVVRAKYIDNTGGSTLVANSVAVNSIRSTGTYKYAYSASEPYGTGTWNNVSGTVNRTKSSLNETLRDDGNFTPLIDFFMIPQAKSAQNVTITCALDGVSKTLNIPAADMPAMTQAGVVYMLDVTITAELGNVTITYGYNVVDWAATKNTEVTNSKYYLRVSQKTFTLPATATSNNSYPLTITTDHPGGWTATATSPAQLSANGSSGWTSTLTGSSGQTRYIGVTGAGTTAGKVTVKAGDLTLVVTVNRQ